MCMQRVFVLQNTQTVSLRKAVITLGSLSGGFADKPQQHTGVAEIKGHRRQRANANSRLAFASHAARLLRRDPPLRDFLSHFALIKRPFSQLHATRKRGPGFHQVKLIYYNARSHSRVCECKHLFDGKNMKVSLWKCVLHARVQASLRNYWSQIIGVLVR